METTDGLIRKYDSAETSLCSPECVLAAADMWRPLRTGFDHIGRRWKSLVFRIAMSVDDGSTIRLKNHISYSDSGKGQCFLHLHSSLSYTSYVQCYLYGMPTLKRCRSDSFNVWGNATGQHERTPKLHK